MRQGEDAKSCQDQVWVDEIRKLAKIDIGEGDRLFGLPCTERYKNPHKEGKCNPSTKPSMGGWSHIVKTNSPIPKSVIL